MNIEIKRQIYTQYVQEHSKNKAIMNNKQSERNDLYIYGNNVYKIIKGWDGFSY